MHNSAYTIIASNKVNYDESVHRSVRRVLPLDTGRHHRRTSMIDKWSRMEGERRRTRALNSGPSECAVGASPSRSASLLAGACQYSPTLHIRQLSRLQRPTRRRSAKRPADMGTWTVGCAMPECRPGPFEPANRPRHRHRVSKRREQWGCSAESSERSSAALDHVNALLAVVHHGGTAGPSRLGCVAELDAPLYLVHLPRHGTEGQGAWCR